MRSTSSVGIKIEGLIDLGPKWSYEYKVLPIAYSNIISKSNNSDNLSHISNVRKDNENVIDVKNVKEKEINNESIERIIDNFHNEHRLINNNETLRNENFGTTHNELEDDTSNSTEINRNNNRGGTQKDSENDERYSKQLRKKVSQGKHKIRKLPNRQKTNIKHKRKVKDDIKIHSFNNHISKQSLKVFSNWKKNTDSLKTKNKIDMLQDSFIEKLSGFLKQNENYVLRTKLAPQKVVVNLMDTAYKMMQRCINYLAKDEDVVRNLNIHLLYKELNRQNEIENIHACKILGACRTNNGYTDFIMNVLTTILQTSNTEIQQASNALTEVVKSNDFSNILDIEAERKLNESINSIELLNTFSTRAMLLIFRNVLLNRNKPIFIMNNLDKNVAQRTEALHNLMDLLNKHMNSKENKNEWRDIEKQVTAWKNKENNNIQEAMERIIKQLKRVLEQLSGEVKQKISDYIKILRTKLEI